MRRKRSSVLDTSATTTHSSLSNFCHEFPGVLDRGHTQPADPAPGGGPPATQVPALYLYRIDPEFGWMHVRLQTWAPYEMQISVNGREWLADGPGRHRVSAQ